MTNGGRHRRFRRRRTTVALAALVAVLAVAGLWELRAELRASPVASEPSPRATISPSAGAVPVPPTEPAGPTASATAHAQPKASPPARITVPAIGVSAPVIRLGLNPDHTLQVPTDFSETGWWSGGVTPGQPGPAVIVGHIDSKSGPAVFSRLRELRPGDRVVVRLRNGGIVTFAVQSLTEVSKTQFPTQKVYGPTRFPTIRLVTCGGSFDTSTGHYVDNIIVFGRMVSAA